MGVSTHLNDPCTRVRDLGGLRAGQWAASFAPFDHDHEPDFGRCASACIAKLRPDSCTHQSPGVMSRVDHAADANMTA